MILKTVLRTFRHYKLLSANQTLIIGVSGGTDSLALLHIMNELRSELGIQLHIGTLNHGIRGRDAEADIAFVKQLAEQWHIHYTAGYTDVPQLAKINGLGIEDAARRARYTFLAEVAHAQGTPYVAVAHHADDQAETILMHMIRGSGLNGLQGMRLSSSMPDHSNLTLIRPLLQVTRAELEQYCIEHGLTPRHDETNDDIGYQRNFIRHEILSRLKQVNPNIVAAFLRLGETAMIDDDFIKIQFQTLVMPHVIKTDGRWTIKLEQFNQLHEALKRRYLLMAHRMLNSMDNPLSTTQILMAIELAEQSQVGTILDIGQGIRLRMDYEYIYIEDAKLPVDNSSYRLIPEGTYLVLPNPTKFIQYNLKIMVLSEKPSDDNQTCLTMPNDVTIALRTRHNGDRFQPKGMKGHSRKIKDWMIDRKIPRDLRSRIPMVTANNEVVAICVGEQWHVADLSQYIVNENRKIYLTVG